MLNQSYVCGGTFDISRAKRKPRPGLTWVSNPHHVGLVAVMASEQAPRATEVFLGEARNGPTRWEQLNRAP